MAAAAAAAAPQHDPEPAPHATQVGSAGHAELLGVAFGSRLQVVSCGAGKGGRKAQGRLVPLAARVLATEPTRSLARQDAHAILLHDIKHSRWMLRPFKPFRGVPPPVLRDGVDAARMFVDVVGEVVHLPQ